ncbi:MAG: hypothetical protein AB7E76_07105 [Deferribacterales bacterium]|jgi:hypothetical protein
MKFTSVLLSICVLVVTLHAFPLRGAEKGSKLDMGKFTYDKGYAPQKDKSACRLLFVYDSEKRLSKKQYTAFQELCAGIETPCLALDKKAAEKAEGRIVTVTDPHAYLKELHIIALPTTIVLDKDNNIIHAIGYEGHYVPKMQELIKEITSGVQSF